MATNTEMNEWGRLSLRRSSSKSDDIRFQGSIYSLAARLPNKPFLRREAGSWVSAVLPNGHVQDSFNVITEEGGTEMRKYVRLLESLFEVTSMKPSPDPVYLRYRPANITSVLTARVYGGSISALDDPILERSGNAGMVKYAVVIERDAKWDTSGSVERSWLAGVHGSKHTFTGVNGAGLSNRIPLTTVIPSDGGLLYRSWLGIKEAPAGVDLATVWDPQISVEASSAVIFQNVGVSEDTDSSYTGYLNNKALKVGFSQQSGWAYRFRLPLAAWNSKSATQANRKYFRGKYKLVARYRTSDPESGDTRFAIEPAIGWRYQANIEPLAAQYLEPTDGYIRYLDLGEIFVGGENWSKDQDDRIELHSYSIWMQCALISGDSANDWIVFDDMFLVPAERFLYFQLEANIDPTYRAEVYFDADGSPDGYVVSNEAADTLISPLETPRRVYGKFTDIVAENWTYPSATGGILVHIADRSGFTKDKRGINTVKLSTIGRIGAY